MRLGQFARKYDIPVQDIISYLEESTDASAPIHPNSKLEESMEGQILEYFEIELPPEPEVIEEVETDQVVEEKVIEEPEVTIKEETTTDEQATEVPMESTEEVSVPAPKPLPATPQEEIAAVEGELAELPPNQRPTSETEEQNQSEEIVVEEPEPTVSEDEIIQTDKLLELLESEEEPLDLEKIKLIKAPKRELSGLKVLGKVELPEPKKKEEKETEEQKSEARKRSKLSEEEREKRRLRAKQKKEAYDARQEKRKIEQEKRKQKAKKEAHYKQQLQKAQTQKSKQKVKEPEPIIPTEPQKSKPKTWVGKFFRWLNTP